MGTVTFNRSDLLSDGYKSFSECPPASVIGVGQVRVGGVLYDCDGISFTKITSEFATGQSRNNFADTLDTYTIVFDGTNTVKTTGGSITATTFINSDGNGSEIGWNAGTVMADGNYVGVKKTLTSSINLSNVDRFFIELGFYKNEAQTRLNLVLYDAGNNSMRIFLGSYAEKAEIVCVGMLKSEFAQFGGSVFDWSAVSAVEVRFISSPCVAADDSRSVTVFNFRAGGYTKPKVILSCDDIATQLDSMFSVCQSRNVKGVHFVTDYEILNGGVYTSGKMTTDRLDAWARIGWKFCAHNVAHRPFAVLCGAYSKSGSIVTMVIYWGTSTNTKADSSTFSINVGDYITVSRCSCNNVNGIYQVASVSQGASSTTITYDVGNATALPYNVTQSDGGVVSVNKYSVANDNLRLQNMIEQHGYPTNKEIMAYTYGQLDETAKQALVGNGIKFARTTSGAGTQGDFFVDLGVNSNYTNMLFQIRRVHGLASFTPTKSGVREPRYNSRLYAIPTLGMPATGALAALQAAMARLIAVGGVLSIYWHGDDLGANYASVQDALINYLADLRDAGTIDLITFDDLYRMMLNRKIG